MLDFKAKMHQIRFPLGFRPRSRWGSLQRSPDPLAEYKGPTSKGREGKWGEERGLGREGMGKGREGRGEEGEEGKRSEGGKRTGSSHAFCFSNLGSSARLSATTAAIVAIPVVPPLARCTYSANCTARYCYRKSSVRLSVVCTSVLGSYRLD